MSLHDALPCIVHVSRRLAWAVHLEQAPFVEVPDTMHALYSDEHRDKVG